MRSTMWTLKFRFKGASWVEIRDARGKVILSKLNPAGSEAEVSGKPPFSVIVGNAPEVELFYNNQGQENSGYMNQSYLKKIGSGVSGLDVNKLVADLKAAPVNKLLNDAQSLATSGHVSATPTFFVATSGQPLQQLQVSGLTGPDFYPQLDKATG